MEASNSKRFSTISPGRVARRDFLTGCTAGAVWGLAASSAARDRTGIPSAGQRLVPPNGQKTDTPATDGDFPGGNIVVERIEGDDVYLHQDQRDTPGFWFYWYFRVRGAAGRTLRFHFTRGNVLAARGPAVSTDGGRTWAWLGTKTVQGSSFAYLFPEDASEVRFCLAVPYLEADLKQFLQRHAGHPHLKVEPHATTRKGRKNLRLRLGRLDDEPPDRILLTCRHHCCEMMASYALEGIMETVLGGTDEGKWFRRNVELLVVPLMDLDGVQDGDQGKNRRPHDHNRDYLAKSIYPSVAALREFVPGWSRGRLRIAIDLHCPWIRGGGDGLGSNEQIFLVGHPAAETWRRQQQFGKLLQQVQSGPLVYNTKHNIPWGRAWNTTKEAKSSSRWTALVPAGMAVTMEIPYANVGGKPVTPQTARLLGHDLARAMRAYLEANGRTPPRPHGGDRGTFLPKSSCFANTLLTDRGYT